jgi:iron complex transport system ATP-binding protein
LDVFYQEEIFRFCRDLCQYGKTILLVSHELPLASRFCTKLLLVGQGRIAAMGIPEEVLTKEKLSTVYGVPIMVRRDAETGHFDVYGISTEDSSRRSLLHSIINKGGGGYDGS